MTPIASNSVSNPALTKLTTITVVAEGHPLKQAQAEGISFDKLLDIYAAAGSDLRPHLEAQ